MAKIRFERRAVDAVGGDRTPYHSGGTIQRLKATATLTEAARNRGLLYRIGQKSFSFELQEAPVGQNNKCGAPHRTCWCSLGPRRGHLDADA